MKKQDLYQLYHSYGQFCSFMWDRWYDWRARKKSMPEDAYPPEHVTIRFQPDEVVFEYGSGQEIVPLSEFFDIEDEDEDEEPDLRMLWHCDYYDGPLSGMAEYEGEMVWFQCCNDPVDGLRLFKLYRLSPEQIEAETARHESFRKHVGWHADHGERYKDYKPRTRWSLNRYYKKAANKTPLDLEGCEEIGGRLFAYHEFKDYARRS